MFIVQYRRIGRNWADMPGMTFSSEPEASAALAEMFRRGNNHSGSVYRVIERTVTETVCD